MKTTNMDGNNYILEYLYINQPYNNDYCNITDMLKQKFADENSIDEAKRLKETLDQLKTRKFIEYHDHKVDSTMTGWLGDDIGGIHTLKNHIIKARLEHDGYEYIKNELRWQRQQELADSQAASTAATNAALQNLATNVLPQNFSSQDNFAKRSLWLNVISVLFIGVTAYVGYREDTAHQVEQLTQQLKKTDTTLKLLQSSLEEVKNAIPRQKDTVDVKVWK